MNFKSRKNHTKLSFIVISIVTSILLLIALEVSVRFLFSDINFQDTQIKLFRKSVFGNTYGLVPNSTGISFGETVFIDSDGFRRIKQPERYNESVLIMGDSVTFGVGVKCSKTFPQLIQDHFSNYKIINASVVGYSFGHYKEVIGHFVDKKISKVLIFFSLNDIHETIPIIGPSKSIFRRITFILKQNSKLYLLLKGIFFDVSRSYASYDIHSYRDDGQEYNLFKKDMLEVSNMLKNSSIQLIVILLPYEYQLRMKSEELLKPQKMICRFCRDNGIECHDSYSYFSSKKESSKSFFLYNDHMHLSEKGHRVVADYVKTILPQH